MNFDFQYQHQCVVFKTLLSLVYHVPLEAVSCPSFKCFKFSLILNIVYSQIINAQDIKTPEEADLIQHSWKADTGADTGPAQ